MLYSKNIQEDFFMIYYLYLTAAIMLELAATTLLKYSEGFTKLLPTVCCCILYGLCSVSYTHLTLPTT